MVSQEIHFAATEIFRNMNMPQLVTSENGFHNNWEDPFLRHYIFDTMWISSKHNESDKSTYDKCFLSIRLNPS